MPAFVARATRRAPSPPPDRLEVKCYELMAMLVLV
jgi:hypothetical protein